VFGADFSSDGRIAVISDDGPGVSVWDLSSETLIVRFDDTSKDFSTVALSPDTEKIALSQFRYREGGGWNSSVEILDYRSKALLKSISIGEGIGDICFSPDGRMIAVAVGNEMDGVGFIEVWDIESGERVTGRLGAAGLESYEGVTFSPDGRYLLASFYDHSEIWSLSIERRISDRFSTPNIGMRGAFFTAEFSEDSATMGRLDRAYDVAPPGAAPVWFADLLEAIGGIRLAESGLPKALEDSFRSLEALRAGLDSLPEDDEWANLARWFLEDESKRRLSPSSSVTVEEFVEESAAKIRAFSPDESYWAHKVRAEIYEVVPDWVED
jgi:hypothetical protein